MKILHVCLSVEYSDNYSYQENLLPIYHKKQGYEVFILASLRRFNENGKMIFLDKESKYKTNEGIQVSRVKYRKPIKLNKIFRKYHDVNKILKEIHPDIVFIHGMQFADIMKFIKYKIHNENVKLFVDGHTDFINSGTNWLSKNILHKIIWRYYAKKIEPYVERFWGVTPLRCDFFKQTYKIGAEKIDLLVMGADEDKIHFEEQDKIRAHIRAQLDISQNNFVLITGGKIDRRKNIHLLMKAFEEINRDNVVLLVFGTPSPDMTREIEELSKYKNIRNIGWIDSTKAYDYYLASDLAVFPGTHSVLWEQAAGCGLPCILKYWKGMDHININNNCIFLMEDSVEEIKKALLQVIDDKNTFSRLKKLAHDARGYFSYNQIARRSISLGDQ